MRLITAVLFLAGALSAQTTCSNPASNPVFIRNEGLAELIGDLTFTCSGTGGAATIKVAISPALPVTSASLSASGATIAYTEALALTTSGSAQGVIDPTGASLTFTSVPIPPGTSTIRITNIRVNASTAPLSVGLSLPIAESVFIFFAGNTSPSLIAATPVAYTAIGLGPQSVAGVTTSGNAYGAPSGAPAAIVACGTQAPALPAFFVKFGESYPLAFKLRGSAATNGSVLAWSSSNTETGYVPAAFPNTPGASNVATSATRIKIVITNVPASTTVYVPVAPSTDTAGQGALILTASETGPLSPFAAVVPTAANGLPTGVGAPPLAAVPNLGGTVTVIYEVINDSAAVETYSIPVYLSWPAGTVTTGTAPGASVSFAPVGASTSIPAFAVSSTTTPLTGPSILQCFTSLLFPFVSNQLGFDTILVIANTSLDPFANGAIPQIGTCNLNFYGSGAPSPPANAPAPLPQGAPGAYPPGSSAVFRLSDVAVGFQGYMIANCNFQFAHGNAFLTSNLGQPSATAMGYLAVVLNRGGASPAESLGN
jgi:hypothetical protein